MITDELRSQLDWQQPPLGWLSPEQQQQVEAQANPRIFKLGEVIWDTDQDTDHQYVVVSGNVRLIPEGGKPILLKGGDWFGALPHLSDRWKARGASKEALVLEWPGDLWTGMIEGMAAQGHQRNGHHGRNGRNGHNGRNGMVVADDAGMGGASTSLRRYWQMVRSRYQPDFSADPIPVEGYPFVAGVNTGSACLTMLSQHFGTPVQLEWMQRQLRSQRPRHMIDGAEKAGVQLRRLLVASWSDLRKLTLPGLIYWQGERWVVAYEVRGDRLVIADPMNPSQGCESIPRDTLQENWDGELWQAELVQKREKFNLGWFLPAVMRYRGLLFEVLVASFTLQLLGLGTPIFTQVIIDKVMVQQSIPTLDVIASAMLGVAIFEAILGILRMFIFTHTTNRLDMSLSAQLFRHLLRLPLAYFEARRVGDTVARVQELEEIRQFLTSTALTVVLDSIFSVIYLMVMMYYSPKLTGVALAVIPLFAILTLTATPILRNWLNETFNRSADSQSFLVETVTGIHTVKAHAAEKATRDRWEGLYARFIRTGFKANTTANISNNLGNFLTSFSSLLLLWVGAHLVIRQEFTIGQLIAFQMLSARVTGPLLRLVQLWQNLQEVLLAVDRIGDILNVPAEAEQGTGLVLPHLQGAVVFDQVFFRYNQEQDSILKGVSFKVEPGMFVGLVGRSGSGKSTLSKLIQRLYDTEAGRITIDGFDVKSADLASLRPQIAVVLQDDFLFNGTVLDNITLGSHNAAPEDVIQAAQMAVAHDFILDLPHGYETNVGERGIALSGGQRQRITLARLFLSDAPILILDEATSHLDAETEQQVLENLRNVSRDRTVFLIAHRFAPLKNADLILAMEKGVVVERGTHQSLLGDKGLYYSLYQRQQAAI
ncbi:MAG: type I secretion system permease/ATPase [Leptolyngbyaceae cyanobacterium]